ncbi:MAG: MBL fold metallo-hydrolase [Planctomycetota bacterium]|nr:MAG: MBL fold metallo-hydrolase [Planctomycetota bacterium]
MKLTVLGAGTIVPSLEYTQSGYLLEAKNKKPMLLDCGAGKILRLLQLEIRAWEIEYIFLTHFHLDHVGDLASILFSKINPALPRNPKLYIYGPPSLSQWYQKLQSLYGSMVEAKYYQLHIEPFEFFETKEIQGMQVTAFPMRHMVEAVGYRFETQDSSLAYSGDTDYCDEVIELGKNTDLFLLECSLPSEIELFGHLNPIKAGKIGNKANTKHLVLTHFYPEVLEEPEKLSQEVRQNYSSRLSLAKDLMRIDIP